MTAQTRGFLFSDLRGYTAFTERHGDRAARDLLVRYRMIVREVIGRHGGAEIRTEGDSFYVVFDSVSQAVEAGLAIQTAVREGGSGGEPVRAGIGIHAGEVEDDAEHGIVSSAVNIAARICSVAKPGDVLVSDTVRGLTRSYLDVTYLPRGRRKLKGIVEPVNLFAVSAPGGQISSPHGSRRNRGVLLGAAIVILGVVTVGLAVIEGSLMQQELAGQVPSTAEPSTLASSPTVVLGWTSASPTGSTAFPNEEEQAMFARLSSAVSREACVRADDDEIPKVPAFHEPGVLLPLPVTAAIRCAMGSGLSVFFYSAGPCTQRSACQSDSETAVFSAASRRGVTAGDCGADADALDRWAFGDAAGFVLCGDDTLWTYDDSNLLGRAVSERPGVAYRWFHENARFPAD